MAFEETLIKALDALHIPIAEEQMRLLRAHYDILVRENAKYNLTAITGEDEAAVKHYADSCAALTAIEFPAGARLIDVGAGAGFPGLVLKIMREDIYLTLMDSTRKKADFGQLCIEALGLKNTRAIHLRAEEMGQSPSHRGKYDIATARAVAPVRVLAEYMLPLLKPGGLMLAYKGPSAGEEMAQAAGALKILGGTVLRAHSAGLEGFSHAIVCIQKIASTPSRYPRKAGLPAKTPL
jgi:16S rRNA (guanine527-N7)-methyltransferase